MLVVAWLASQLARGGSLRVLAPPLEVAGFSIHMAWHDRDHGDAAQRWVRERLAAYVSAVDGAGPAP